MEKHLNLLYGRELLQSEMPAKLRNASNNPKMALVITPTFFEKQRKIFCQRCQHEMTKVRANECVCGQACAYCRNCINMGKVRKCENLYGLSEPNQFPAPEKNRMAWMGKLSEQQELAAEKIIQAIAANERHLLWAVAGAGKTEMLFAGIEQALKNNKRVCLASPRVDVCLELAPRLAEAFPQTPLAVLYGEMKTPYAYTQLVIATTHQLFRFRAAFDVLIIDEIDAFPFRDDASLQFAAEKARKEVSALIYLSATPSLEMQKEVRQKKLAATILPARYHGHPLPVPVVKWCVNWRRKLLKQFLKTTAGRQIAQLIEKGRRFLVFVPNIEWMQKFEKVLRKIFPQVAFAAVSAADPKRKEKVMQMRRQEVQFLVTSTILERGVTFSNIDVLVIGAEDRIFTESALVQIAGRCGRAPAYPTGDVVFYHDGQSLAMKGAIKQIKQMNTLAEQRGLLQ